MKTKTIIAILLLVLAGYFSSCNRKENEEIGTPVLLTAYPLYTCLWMFADKERNRLFMINSDQELRNILLCLGDSYPPDIDFSKYTLLFGHGDAPPVAWGGGIHVGKIDLRRLSTNKYQLNIIMFTNTSTGMSSWRIAHITNKLDSEAEIRLNVTLNR